MRFSLITALLVMPGCAPFDVCDVVGEVPLPARLSETGLDAAGVRPYAPSFALWSDGADKRRWLWLPPGATIDTSEPDEWQLPIGTRAWKEFSLDGVRLETRLIQRLDDGSWADVAYRWSADQLDATAVVEGASDTGSTMHDIPAAGTCRACHGGRASHLLGISALQLAHDPAPGELALAELVRDGRLSDPPAVWPEVPGEPAVQAALGYLHANCSHCHNQARPARAGARCYDPDNDLDFALRLDALASPAATATYRTVVGDQIERGDPDGSRVIELMSTRGGGLQMPPLATERSDADGLAILDAWIRSL